MKRKRRRRRRRIGRRTQTSSAINILTDRGVNVLKFYCQPGIKYF
jgi:hypothetical protein